MFERRLIFQEGGSSLGLYAWVALAMAAVLIVGGTGSWLWWRRQRSG